MKKALIFLASLVGVPAVLFLIMGKMSQTGQAPVLVDGKLSQCPSTLNCICSKFKADEKHFTDPIFIHSDEIFKKNAGTAHEKCPGIGWWCSFIWIVITLRPHLKQHFTVLWMTCNYDLILENI
jgi:hypothetical protein